MEGLDKELVEFVSARNEGRPRKCLSFGPFFGGPPIEVIEERLRLRQVIPPNDRASVLMLEGMMYAAVKVIYEAPLSAISAAMSSRLAC